MDNEVNKEYNKEEECDNYFEKLEDYVEIHPDNYIDINKWQWVKYINSNNEYKHGGLVLENYCPEHLLLFRPYSKYKNKWKIKFGENRIFIKKLTPEIQKEKTEKNNLYRLYKAGYVTISETPNPDLVQD